MIRNYFLIALRNFRNNKLFSFINIFGLAVGLTCCLLIALYIRHELSYDKYHVNINNLYQLGTVFKKETGDDYSTTNSSWNSCISRVNCFTSGNSRLRAGAMGDEFVVL